MKLGTLGFKGADSELTTAFLNCLPKIPFLGKLGPELQKCFALNETWVQSGISSVQNSEFDNFFLKFRPKTVFLGKFGPKIFGSILPRNGILFWAKLVTIFWDQICPQEAVLGMESKKIIVKFRIITLEKPFIPSFI